VTAGTEGIRLPPRPSERDGDEDRVSAPRAGATAQSAPARTREKAWFGAKVVTLTTGASVIQPMLDAWALGSQSARYYRSGLFRWPRLAWAAVHSFVIVPALDYLKWATESPPKIAGNGLAWWITLALMLGWF
jgi:hypothetical protein